MDFVFLGEKMGKTSIKYKLGIDLGTASIGLVAYELDTNDNIKGIAHIDGYIFREPIEPKKKVTENSIRTSFRLRRRQIERKAKRLKKLVYLANSIGIKKEDVEKIYSDKIHKLRAKAINEKIELPEFIKVLFHIVKNRGYKGNLKNKGDISKSIELTENKLKEYCVETIGQLEYKLKQESKEDNKYINQWKKISKDGTYIYRKNIEDEFEKIWNTQEQYHNELKQIYKINNQNYFPEYKNRKEITLKEAFKSAIFYQRPIKWDIETIGNCILEPQEKRASTAHPIFQKYRIWDVINNIEVKNYKTKQSRNLTQEEKTKYFDFINDKIDKYNQAYEMPYKEIYKNFNIDTMVEKFNIDTRRKDSDKGIKANKTKKVFQENNLLESFENLNSKEQEILIEFLSCITDFDSILDNDDEYIMEFLNNYIYKIVKNQNEGDINKVLSFIDKIKNCLDNPKSTLYKLEKNRKPYSVKALINIVSRLESGENKEEIINTYKKEKIVLNKLLPFNKVKTNNILVDRPLREFKRTLNYAIHKLGGNPKSITIELSRDLKKSLSMRNFLDKEMSSNRDKTQKIIKELQSFGVIETSQNIFRYRLWKEQEHKCVYCGQEINQFKCYNEKETEIDHIIPQSCGGEDKYSNFVLVHSNCNLKKGENTPYLASKQNKVDYEFVENFADKLEQIAKTIKKKPVGNKWIEPLEKKELVDKIDNLTTEKSIEQLRDSFTETQLHSTSWITKIVLDWCKNITEDVIPSYGSLTGYLRNCWVTNLILPKVRIAENQKLYNEYNKEINTQIWEALNTKSISFGDIDKDSELYKSFEKYKKTYLEKNPTTRKEEKVIFQEFKKEYRKNKEYIFYKRCDHRHHIVDAAVIGLVTRSLMQKANTYYTKNGTLYEVVNNKTSEIKDEFRPENPYKQLNDTLQKYLINYVVWNKPDRLPSKEICNESAYGIIEKDNNKYLVQRYPLQHLLKNIKTLEDLKNKIDEIIVGVAIKKSIKEQLEQRISQGLSLEDALLGKKEDMKDGIYFNGNKIKKIKCVYKEKALMTYKDGVDVEVKNQKNKIYKVYRNGGYACMDFNKNTFQKTELVPLHKYLKEYKDKSIPKNIIRVFANDIVYDKKEKMFYKVKSFHNEQGLICNKLNSTLKDAKGFPNIKNIILIKDRNIIRQIKQNGK